MIDEFLFLFLFLFFQIQVTGFGTPDFAKLEALS